MEKSTELFSLKNTRYDLLSGYGTYVGCMHTYLGYFEEIPSLKRVNEIDYKKARKWVEEHLKGSILRRHVKERTREKQNAVEQKDTIYVLRNRMLIDIEDDGRVIVLHDELGEESAEKVLQQLMKFKKRNKRTTDIGFVVSSASGLTVVDSKINKPRLCIQKHYNDDLASLHHTIVKQLRTKNRNGLILLHGLPGTGKSTYIRYLIHCQRKRVIFMPSGIAQNMESPDLLALLLENRNSVLVIEDAEDLLTSRDANLNSGISTLLNLTDGLLGESLGIQVICTFNTQIGNIDKALLRKGRLMAMYEFKLLAAGKTGNLLRELNAMEHFTHQPMTLAEIFNIQQSGFDSLQVRKKKIGFEVA